jgi:hypothetical protein
VDAYTNNFAILGTRTTGPDGGTFRLAGPREAAEGPGVIRAPTDHVWALARILVDGPHDLEACRAVQAGISMQGPAHAPPGPYASRGADWRAYFTSASALLAANPPPATDLALLRRIAPLGLMDRFDPDRFPAAQAAEIEAGLAEGRDAVRGGGGLGGTQFIDGWTYPTARLGDFGQDYALRATVALGGLAALPPEEAMYMQAEGPGPRKLFDGAQAWRLHFPAHRLPPVNSFWSLSLYEATADGQFFFCDNPLGRYAIGDRTPGLSANPDGSLDIWIGRAMPPGKGANWLPAPTGPFALFLRAYLPGPELLEGRYRLPPVVAA